MIDHAAVLLACRSRLATLSVATTGSATLAATATGYTRTSGSFVTDGFATGMQLLGTGFTASANNSRKTISSVTALVMEAPGTSVEASGTRTLSVGLPTMSSENIPFAPEQDEPYIEEQYVPGPMTQLTISTTGELEALPLYVLEVRVPQHTGMLGMQGYVKALQTLFKPGTGLTVTDHTVVVRRDTAPFPSQLLQIDSHAVVTLTIPLRVRTVNV